MSSVYQFEYGAGVEWAEGIEEEILDRLSEVDCVELIPENFFFGRRRSFLKRLAASGKPVLIHGVELSLGTAEPLKEDHLDRILEVAGEVNTVEVSDHLCMTEAGGVEIGQLTPLAWTRRSADAVARNIESAMERMPWPFAIENIALRFVVPFAELSEAEHLSLVLRKTGCHLLLDLHNLHANAHNFGFDPHAWLSAVDLSRVSSIHLAGGHVDDEGTLVDSHSHPVPPRVWDLLARVGSEVSPRWTIVERTENFPPYSELLAEIAEARRVLGEAAGRARGANGAGVAAEGAGT
ncbi:MAG: DUF692 domain-containing protein [Polyangiaceae bacterium]